MPPNLTSLAKIYRLQLHTVNQKHETCAKIDGGAQGDQEHVKKAC